MSSDLQGRNAVVFGVANKRSIAWSIAQGLHAAGMKLAITYQNERLEQEAKDLILSLPGAQGFMCDVSQDEEIDRLFATLKERYGKLQTLVHSVAYAPADELKGDFVNTTREGFRIAMDVSVYSLVAHVKRSRRTRPTGPPCGSQRSRFHRSLPRLRRQQRNHRRGHLCGLRLQHHGLLKSLLGSPRHHLGPQSWDNKHRWGRTA
jgi:NAD(P)-dependent dehydrogenase (short-subunit alcohol dehydrogenase family)